MTNIISQNVSKFKERCIVCLRITKYICSRFVFQHQRHRVGRDEAGICTSTRWEAVRKSIISFNEKTEEYCYGSISGALSDDTMLNLSLEALILVRT